MTAKDKELFFQLLERYNAGTATPEEIVFVERYLEALDHRASDAGKNFEQHKLTIEQEIKNQLFSTIREEARPPVIRKMYTRYWWAAASVILLIAAFLLYKPETPQQVVKLEDINAGKAGAVLTLANGQQVVLDSLGNGIVATQGGATVTLRNGALSYDNTGDDDRIVYNTMTTPKGRQYQIVLPDGTKVWLNAASSITYPTSFSNERNVKITGEAYFEVAKRDGLPFIVKIGEEAGVEVLGTSFNVNAYKDKGGIDATLVEGSIRVRGGADAKIMQPGEQAHISSAISIDKHADIDKVLAWKNGIFNFEETGLREMMMQIERWYDIKVIYAPDVPDVKFFGKISRTADLTTVLEALQGFGLHYEMKTNRQLLIKP